MQVQIRFPFSLRAVPIGCRSEKYIHATYDHAFEIPEILASDAPVVMKADHCYTHAAWSSFWTDVGYRREYQPLVSAARKAPYEMRKFGNKFYTLYCETDETTERFLYEGRPAGRRGPTYPENTLLLDGIPADRHRLACIYDRADQGNATIAKTNKRDAFRSVTWISDKFPPFHTWSDTLSKFRAEDLIEAQEAYQALASRVVLIDGKIWISSGIPCIKVHYNETVTLSHEEMPDFPSDALCDQYFPLNAADEALKYASQIAEGKDIIDMRLPLEIDTNIDFTFDYREFRIWRQAQVLAVHCMLAIRSGNKGKLAVTDKERSTIESAYEEAEKFNPIMGLKGEPEKYIYELTRLAQQFDRKWFPGFYSTKNNKLNRKQFLMQTLEMYDDRPINFL